MHHPRDRPPPGSGEPAPAAMLAPVDHKERNGTMASPNLARWYGFVKAHDPSALDDLLADDAVFTSPIVHTPQRGKALTKMYLSAADIVLANETFAYVREFDCGSRAVLEFTCEIDGIAVNGVDMIEWNEDGRITDFKVMVRPLKAIQKLHAAMGEMLAKMQKAS